MVTPRLGVTLLSVVFLQLSLSTPGILSKDVEVSAQAAADAAEQGESPVLDSSVVKSAPEVPLKKEEEKKKELPNAVAAADAAETPSQLPSSSSSIPQPDTLAVKTTKDTNAKVSDQSPGSKSVEVSQVTPSSSSQGQESQLPASPSVKSESVSEYTLSFTPATKSNPSKIDVIDLEASKDNSPLTPIISNNNNDNVLAGLESGDENFGKVAPKYTKFDEEFQDNSRPGDSPHISRAGSIVAAPHQENQYISSDDPIFKSEQVYRVKASQEDIYAAMRSGLSFQERQEYERQLRLRDVEITRLKLEHGQLIERLSKVERMLAQVSPPRPTALQIERELQEKVRALEIERASVLQKLAGQRQRRQSMTYNNFPNYQGFPAAPRVPRMAFSPRYPAQPLALRRRRAAAAAAWNNFAHRARRSATQRQRRQAVWENNGNFQNFHHPNFPVFPGMVYPNLPNARLH